MPKTRFDAQVLTPYMRLGRVAAMTMEEYLAASGTAPVVRAPKPPTFLQLQAQRRNVLRSTGPRTSAGKRRAALNSSKWRSCSKIEQMLMALEGRNPFEYRRLHRQLTYWFAPSDLYSRRLVADLAEIWWEKVSPPRAQRDPKMSARPAAHGAHLGIAASPERLRPPYRRLEYFIDVLLDLMSERSRKWKYLLGTRLGEPIRNCNTVRDLLRLMEGQLKAAGIPAPLPHATRMNERGMDADEIGSLEGIEQFAKKRLFQTKPSSL